MFNQRKRTLAGVFLAATLLIAACGSDDDAGGSEAPAETSDAVESTDDGGAVESTDDGGAVESTDDGGAVESTDDGGTVESTDDGGAEAETDRPSGDFRWGIRDYFEETATTIIAAYQEVNPGASIELELLPTDEAGYTQRLLTARLGDQLPDIIAHADVFTEEFAESEITADLTPLLDQSDSLSVDYFSPAFMEVYEVKTGSHVGEIHALPQGADAIVLYYNKDLFDEAGLDYPTDSWTYSDLTTAAEALTADNQWGFAETPDWHARYNPALRSFGVEAVNENGSTADIGSAEAIEAWKLMIEPMIDGPFVPWEELQASTATALFAQGRVAMFPGVRAQLPQIMNEAAFDWDVAANPIINGERFSGSGSVALAMTTAAENTDLIRDFLEWFYSEEGGMPILTESYGVVPPVPSLYDSSIWRDLPAPPGNTDAFVTAVDTGVGAPLLAATSRSDWDQLIKNSIEAVTLNGDDIETVFTKAQDQAQQILDEAAAG